ncbi:MAG: type II secretion system protein N [Pseudomonadota bacterium]|nr:type II secretion system protein N [Pseudomonadota bacterium]
MKRYLAVGFIIFLFVVIAAIPAGIVARSLENIKGLSLVEPRGTLWTGQAHLLIQGRRMGILKWDLIPTSFFSLTPTAVWTLQDKRLSLEGNVSGIEPVTISVSGNVDMALFAPLLKPYDLIVPGTIAAEQVSITFFPGTHQFTQTGGKIRWSGGQVHYILSGQHADAILPPMVADLTTTNRQPIADIYAEGEPTQLMRAEITAEGTIKIGITKMFTKLLTTPWPGSDPDHAIVLEVEEQIL